MADKQIVSFKIPVSRLSIIDGDSQSFEVNFTDSEITELKTKLKEETKIE